MNSWKRILSYSSHGALKDTSNIARQIKHTYYLLKYIVKLKHITEAYEVDTYSYIITKKVKCIISQAVY